MNLWRTFLDRLVLLPSKPATADWLSRQYYRFQINHTEEQSHNLFLMLNFFSHCFLYRACMCLLCTSSCTTSCVGQLKQVTQLRWVDRMGRILCTREWDPPLWEATSANQLKISSVPWKRYTYRAYIVITLTHFSHFYLTYWLRNPHFRHLFWKYFAPHPDCWGLMMTLTPILTTHPLQFVVEFVRNV